MKKEYLKYLTYGVLEMHGVLEYRSYAKYFGYPNKLCNAELYTFDVKYILIDCLEKPE